jgi:hypothetical protein
MYQESTSGRRIEPDLAEVLNFLLGGLSSKLAETSIFRLEDSALPTWEKYSTSSQRIDLYLAEAQYILVGRLSLKLVETIIFRPEEQILPD